MKVDRTTRKWAYGIAASVVALFGGIATLELKDRIGYSEVNGYSYPVNNYLQNGKSTFYHPNSLTSVKLIDENGDGVLDKKQITTSIPRGGCKFNVPPTLEDQVLFGNILANLNKTNTSTKEISKKTKDAFTDEDLLILLPWMLSSPPF